MAEREGRDRANGEVNVESRREEYLRLRSEGVLPADIGATWRLDEAGRELRERLIERFAFDLEKTPQAIGSHLPPEVVLNLGRLAHDAAAAAFRLGVSLAGIDEVQSPLMPTSPFQGIAEVRRDRIESDPGRGNGNNFGREVAIDVEPLCALMIVRLGLLKEQTGDAASALRGPKMLLSELLDVPLVEGRNGHPVSVKEFGAAEAERAPIERSEELIESMFSVISDPAERLRGSVEMIGALFEWRDRALASALLEKIPDALRRDAVTGGTLDLRFLSTRDKEAIVDLTGIVNDVGNALDVLRRVEGADLRSRSEPFVGRELSGREVAERAINERVTHDSAVQLRVAERFVFERVTPEEYCSLTDHQRRELKAEIESALSDRVERRRVMLESAQRLEVAPLLKRVAEGLEQARYELRCFRLSKSRL